MKELEISKRISLITISLFLLHPNIIYYSSEIKQYPTDIFAVLSFIFIALKIIKTNGSGNRIKLALLVVPLFYFSNITIIIFPVLALFILYFNYKHHQKLKTSSILILSIWLMSIISYYFLFVYNHASKDLMLKFWTGIGLPNLGVTTLNDYFNWGLKIIWEQLFYGLIADENLVFAIIASIVFMIGLFFLIKGKRYTIIILVLFTIISHLLMSFLMLYPFYKRIILYMLPLYLIFISGFMDVLYSKFAIRKFGVHFINSIIGILFMLMIYNNAIKFPSEYDPYKAAVTYLSQKGHINDDIIVFAGMKRISYYNDLSKPFKDKFIPIGVTDPINEELIKLDTIDLKKDYWLIFSYGRSEWKDKVFPILKKNGTITFVKGHNTLLRKNDGYLYKFTPF